MGDSFNNEEAVREYLLGRVSDEALLEGLEERLFTDEEFCSRVALAEDGLINDYVFGYLDEADAASFRATLAGNLERSFKLSLTQALREKALGEGVRDSAEGVKESAAPAPSPSSFFAPLGALFRQPRYAGAFAVLLLAALASAAYLFRSSGPDELAELREIYGRQRPTSTRISEFGYAPLSQLRGEPEPGERNRLRRVQNSLIEATEDAPGARTHHALGVYYLTQREYADAIREFESALKFAARDAKIHNDLGAAYFEQAAAAPEGKRFEPLAYSLEEFTAAVELDGNLLEALFNKSLALQELKLSREAKQSWTLYLQKDPSSPWADEARRHLGRLDDEQTRFKTDAQVLEYFLAAYRGRDEARARRSHDETKGLLAGPAVALQLSRRYLLARRRGDEDEARESVEALAFIGDFERERHAEFFFLNSPASTRA